MPDNYPDNSDDYDSDDYDSDDYEENVYDCDEISPTKYNIVLCELFNNKLHGNTNEDVCNHYLLINRIKKLDLDFIDSWVAPLNQDYIDRQEQITPHKFIRNYKNIISKIVQLATDFEISKAITQETSQINLSIVHKAPSTIINTISIEIQDTLSLQGSTQFTEHFVEGALPSVFRSITISNTDFNNLKIEAKNKSPMPQTPIN
jgi:hypothetical protein